MICDVVNVLGRADGGGHVVTGPVWEYFSGGRADVQAAAARVAVRGAARRRRCGSELIAADLDGLIREVHLDKANGLIGKTVIHPSHVAAVHALSVVTHEEYCDAADILAVTGGRGDGQLGYAQQDERGKPHRAWAERLMLRARVFGVAARDVTFVDLLEAADCR